MNRFIVFSSLGQRLASIAGQFRTIVSPELGCSSSFAIRKRLPSDETAKGGPADVTASLGLNNGFGVPTTGVALRRSIGTAITEKSLVVTRRAARRFRTDRDACRKRMPYQ